MNWIAWDFDGVIVDTRQVVREAYRRTGVEQPVGAERIHGTVWLSELGFDSVEVSRILAEKYRHQRELIAEAPLLPPATIIQRHLGPQALVTYAPLEIIASTDISTHFDAIHAGRNFAEKIEALQELGQGTYVDDWDSIGESIASKAGWKFVHYHGQSAEELMGDLSAQ